MNFFKIISVFVFVILFSQSVLGDNHDTEQKKNIVDQAKDINEQLNAKQAATEANINSEIGQNQNEEEPLPLNDPFAGDAPSGATVVSKSDEKITEIQSLKRYKLVGVFEGNNSKYITLVNETAEFISIELFEEISDKIKLVDVNLKEVTFQKEDGKYLIMNFKNQIKAKDEL